jgi:hypothetical protein
MVKKIIWSKKAAFEKRSILANEIHEILKYISLHNYLGRNTDYKNVHVTICREYLIFYEIADTIYVLAIWDSRRNPEDLKLK